MINISFISGTRADYGKIKPYIDFLCEQEDKNVFVFVTGMNMLKKYGSTYQFIQTDLKKKCHIRVDKKFKSKETALELAHITKAYHKHLKKDKIDFVFVHGDRSEVLAAASAAVLNTIPVCHIEAGDFSGSVDELIRHSTSKLSQRFLVGDEAAKNTLIQLGEKEESIFITGNSSLAFEIGEPTAKELKILNSYKDYAVLIYHPVTTLSKEVLKNEIDSLLIELKKSQKDYVVIFPNNDFGSDIVLKAYQKYATDKKFHFVKSFSFNAFNYLLKNADFLIGNSSCGIKEAPFYHVPVIDVGCRQNNRYQHLGLQDFYHLDDLSLVLETIEKVKKTKKKTVKHHYREAFFKQLKEVFTDDFFNVKIQKTFQKIKKEE